MARLKVNKKGKMSIKGLVTNGKYPYVTDFNIEKSKLQNAESELTITIKAILKTPRLKLKASESLPQ